MRHSLRTIAIAFLAGLAGSFVGNRLIVAVPVFAQAEAAPKVLRVQRLELVDRTGLLRAVLDATENQLPRLEFKDQFDGKERSLLINPSMVHMKLGDQSATLSAMGTSIAAGKNAILLDVGAVGFGAHPQLIISSASGTGRISSFAFDITDSSGKLIWATPIKLP